MMNMLSTLKLDAFTKHKKLINVLLNLIKTMLFNELCLLNSDCNIMQRHHLIRALTSCSTDEKTCS